MNVRWKEFPLFLKGSLLLLLGIETLQIFGCSLSRLPVNNIPEDLPRSEDILQIVKKRDDAVQSMRGLMSLLVRSGQKKLHIEEAFQVQEPAKIRIEALGLFGQPVFFLVSDGINLSIFLPDKKRLYVGGSSAGNIADVLPVSLELYEIVDILTGKIPFIDSQSQRAGYDQKEGLMVIDLTPPPAISSKQRLWIDIQKRTVVRGELRDGEDQLKWRVTFDRFQEIQGILTPTAIKIEMPGGPTTVSIELEELEMNPVLRENSFQLSVPEGTEIWSLR